MKLRLAPGLVALNSPLGFTILSPHLNRQVDGGLLEERSFVTLLEQCREWIDRGQVSRLICERMNADSDAAEATIDELLGAGMLVMDADDQADGFRAQEEWSRYGWDEPFRFHWTINHIERFNYRQDGRAADIQMMESFVKAETPPPQYKEFTNKPFIALESNVDLEHGSVEDAFIGRQGAPRDLPMTLREFSWLTKLAYGQTAVRRLFVTGEHVAKTSPSGGSRHPTEVYPLVIDVEGLEPGLYHYSVKRHGLELLVAGNHTRFLREHIICREDRPNFRPRVAFVYTSIFARSMFRYRESFSYRVMHHDIGHLMTTFSLLLSSLSRPAYSAYSFHDEEVRSFLELDGYFEAPMAYSLAG
ncbi:hypothetical protein D187_010325 [Cystobacter fuscus DSM 2262]|uniref:Nitroreductase domain-containing protein n=1 Tax=Cystobacter fuscus (strain ATCC 25194 / DSM 2262 / NBRC 100088 / M29) TaxID=1242864 RepID=S9PF89_CYSF2|nr:SagB/ThcOx family dehydrogenase [Cystobacter fuscus]EPX61706.1 hypothetical protein D187_010325 [Cystobacter fuscus DSM 2262]